MRNPQAFNQMEQLIKNKGNPKEFFNQITSKYTPEQMQQFKKFANSFGYTDDKLKEFGINSNKEWYKNLKERREEYE